ncbi:MAG: hypothetical protein HY823_13400 [Acidobacteria bacterium]|nr:hypothetical protein [Acidobacteriota bacterium]
MYIGHYAVALAFRPRAPRVPLALLWLAAVWADFLWLLLLFAGVERAEVKPGTTVVNALDLQHYPLSHGLAETLGWSLLFSLGWYAWRRDRAGALWLGLAVLSHWLLDWVTHRPDLPLLWGNPKFGLGLWNHRVPSLALEGGLFVLGLVLYLRGTRGRRWWGTALLWLFVAFCLGTYLPDAAGMAPPPPGIRAVLPMLPLGLLVMLWVHGIDRGRDWREASSG